MDYKSNKNFTKSDFVNNSLKTQDSFPETYEDEIDFYELWLIVKKNLKLIVVATFIFFVGAIFYASRLPNIYEATTNFFVPKIEGQGLSMGLSESSFGFNMSDTSVDLVDNLFKSRRMQRDIVRHFDLIRVYQEKTEKKQKSTQKNHQKMSGTTNFQANEDSLINLVKGTTRVEKNKSNFIKLSVENEDKVLAANIANFYLENLENINEELKLTTMKPMVKIIDRAEIPILKSKPKRSQIIMIGTILGLFGGIFLSFFIEAIKKQKPK